MEEKRHSQRSEMTSKLMIKRLDSDEAGEEVSINITDVSKGGVGFTCNKALEIGAVYESFLEIWTKEVLHTFLEIVRIEKTDDGYIYGSSFVGLPEMEAQRIATYQTVTNMNQQ
ncbi:MAG: PilZ domain-containing protein [Lachnospiraceae bacterium]|nr:PilZ domain-containing protein [Lachnospiraceae bacterium]